MSEITSGILPLCIARIINCKSVMCISNYSQLVSGLAFDILFVLFNLVFSPEASDRREELSYRNILQKQKNRNLLRCYNGETNFGYTNTCRVNSATTFLSVPPRPDEIGVNRDTTLFVKIRD